MARRLALALLAATLSLSCAGAGRFAPATADRAAEALRAWEAASARAGLTGDANLLYSASLSQKAMRTQGTLAVRLRGNSVDATLSGPFGTPLATYRDGRLTGEKIEPVSLPMGQLRAVLAGTWNGGPPAVSGVRGAEVQLAWTGADSAEGIFDVGSGQLVSLKVARPEGELVARYSGPRDPWPTKIEIEEKRTRSKLRLERIGLEASP